MKTKSQGSKLLFTTMLMMLLLALQTSGQNFFNWTETVPLTDSVSNNTNAHLRLFYYNGGGPIMAMVWENSADSLSTSIFYKDLLGSSDPQVLASSPGVHYTHPKIFYVGDQDTLFYVFYQTDQGGDQDIYYLKYSLDGQFSGPYPFATEEGNEGELAPGLESEFFDDAGESRYIMNAVSWTRDGMLLCRDLERDGDVFSFSDPVIIDSVGCSSPSMINWNQIYFLKENGDSTWIYTTWRFSANVWNTPEVFFHGGNSTNLSSDRVTGHYLTWSAETDSHWKIFIDYSDVTYNGFSLEPISLSPIDPAICTWVIGVDQSQPEFMDVLMAYPWIEIDFDEIYVNPDPYNPLFMNFSNSGTTNRKPEFFLGENTPWPDWCFYVYMVWEEWRNGHWQIFSAKMEMCVGAIGENSLADNTLKAYPNPFNNELTLSYELYSSCEVRIEIFDIYGKKVADVFDGEQQEGSQVLTWNGKSSSGSLVAPGLYLVRLQFGGKVYAARVVKGL